MIGSECKSKSLNSNIIALLDFELIQHKAIATRIEAFVGRIAHRVVRNMICLQKNEELVTMLHESNTSSQIKADAEEENIRPNNWFRH